MDFASEVLWYWLKAKDILLHGFVGKCFCVHIILQSVYGYSLFFIPSLCPLLYLCFTWWISAGALCWSLLVLCPWCGHPFAVMLWLLHTEQEVLHWKGDTRQLVQLPCTYWGIVFVTPSAWSIWHTAKLYSVCL